MEGASCTVPRYLTVVPPPRLCGWSSDGRGGAGGHWPQLAAAHSWNSISTQVKTNTGVGGPASRGTGAAVMIGPAKS